jgi:Uma2 family endonuclease
MGALLTPPQKARTLADLTRTLGEMSVRDLADLLRDLGDIPPERVWLTPQPGTATAKDVIEAEAKYNRLCELVDGTLVEKTMGFTEGRVALVLGIFLEDFVYAADLGFVLGADGMMRIAPDLVRIPDVSFVSFARLPSRELPAEPIPDLAPDLAVEVLSAGNTPKEMTRKLREYFDAGVRQVWLVDDEAKTIEVYTSPTKSRTYSGKQIVKGGKVLPGFELSVETFFNRVHMKK